MASSVINWDSPEGRDLVLASHERLMERVGARRLASTLPVVLFDELHMYARWKSFLKVLLEAHGDEVRGLVTGSSRMDVYRRGGDSLMGRHFLYRMHPFSVAGLVIPALPDPTRDLRETQLVREDIRDLSQVQQLDQLATLTALLATRSAHQRHLRQPGEGSADLHRHRAALSGDPALYSPGLPRLPRVLVEVKHRETSIGPALRHCQESLRLPFAFPVVIEADYVDAGCFARPGPPLVVPARTFLSQLL